MKSPKILSIGEVLWDLFPDDERFGGAPANFACHAAINGGDVAMVSAVGNDDHGHRAIEILKSYRVDVSLIQILPNASTGTVGIHLDAAGKPTFTIHENSAWDQLQWSDPLCQRILSANAICFGTLGQRSPEARATIRRCVETAASAGITRVLDINLRAPFYDDAVIRESIQLASILKLSDEELPRVCQACRLPASPTFHQQAKAILEAFHLQMVIVTRGAEGAMVVTRDETAEQPGIPADVKDTVGAGDAFTAAFLMGLLQQKSLRQNLEQACIVAARACSHAGAVPKVADLKSQT